MNQIQTSVMKKKKNYYRREDAEDFIIEIIARILKDSHKRGFKKRYVTSNKIGDILCKKVFKCLDLRETIRNEVKPVVKDYLSLNSSKKIILDFSTRKQKKENINHKIIKSFSKVAVKADLPNLIVGLRSLCLAFEDNPSFQNFDQELLVMWTNLKEQMSTKKERIVMKK